MRIVTVALLATVALAAFSSSVHAEFRGGPGMGFGGPRLMLEHMADHLDLDDTQRETVKNILEAAKPEMEALREQFRANRAALEALDASDPAYSTELNNIALSNGQLATDGTLLFTRVRAEVNAVLTEEQRAKAERFKERKREAFERRADRR